MNPEVRVLARWRTHEHCCAYKTHFGLVSTRSEVRDVGCTLDWNREDYLHADNYAKN